MPRPSENGSFETSTANPGSSFVTLGAGSTDIAGWTVGSGSIDYIGGYWTASDGSKSIDLSGSAAGSIWQTFDTIAGQTYFIDVMISGNPDGPPPTKTLEVTATGNAAQDYTHDVGSDQRPTSAGPRALMPSSRPAARPRSTSPRSARAPSTARRSTRSRSRPCRSRQLGADDRRLRLCRRVHAPARHAKHGRFRLTAANSIRKGRRGQLRRPFSLQ